MISWTRSGHFQLWMGLSVALCGLFEVVEVIENHVRLAAVGAPHGVVLLGALHAMKGLGDVFEGVKRSHEGRSAEPVAAEADGGGRFPGG